MTSAPTLAPTDMWPAFTTHSDTDVVIAAVSLTRLVGWCGTPCVHTADAVIPNSGGRPSESDLASVVIARVISVEWRSDLGLHAVIDADLSGCQPLLAQARLMGRTSPRSSTVVILKSQASSPEGYAALLPADLSVGDLIVVPCTGVSVLHAVKVPSATARDGVDGYSSVITSRAAVSNSGA